MHHPTWLHPHGPRQPQSGCCGRFFLCRLRYSLGLFQLLLHAVFVSLKVWYWFIQPISNIAEDLKGWHDDKGHKAHLALGLGYSASITQRGGLSASSPLSITLGKELGEDRVTPPRCCGHRTCRIANVCSMHNVIQRRCCVLPELHVPPLKLNQVLHVLQVLTVIRHICGQDNPHHLFSELCKLSPCKILEAVDLPHQLERNGSMHILIHGAIIILNGCLISLLYVEIVGDTWMTNIMTDGTNKT
mmetsp:Transcript_15187/g.26871  ORF Transcript_15187/g.26871 Transcript_15187/m.26871 type:complete len:245 (-) Transcript_15187:1043-1777(-)